jgi:hypothetical protein
MSQRRFSKVLIVLKDSPSQNDYNKRLLEYLTDRHTAINDNNFTIAIEVADDTNINEFVLQGMTSLPAMRISTEDPYIYGVNSILAMLAKLEMIDNGKSVNANANMSTDDSSNPFLSMVLEEMQNAEEDDGTAPSTIKAYREDFAETPLSEKMIEEKTKAYSKIYEDRRRKTETHGGRKSAEVKYTPGGNARRSGAKSVDVESFIKKGGFDKGEEMLMREIAANL